jgi:hypothetical protein
MRSSPWFVAIVLIGCGHHDEPAAPTLGRMSDALLDRARAACGADFDGDSAPSYVAKDVAAKRKGHKLVAAGCVVPDKGIAVELDYDADTHEVLALAGHVANASEIYAWLDALATAGAGADATKQVRDAFSDAIGRAGAAELAVGGIHARVRRADDGRNEFTIALE